MTEVILYTENPFSVSICLRPHVFEVNLNLARAPLAENGSDNIWSGIGCKWGANVTLLKQPADVLLGDAIVLLMNPLMCSLNTCVLLVRDALCN